MSGRHCFINSHTLSEEKNPNPIDSTKKRDGNIPNVSEMKYNVLKDGVDIDAMLYASTLHQFDNTE